MAIPVVRKEGFECPPAHVEALNQWLPEVDRVLIVGWRGTEGSFLERWRELVKDDLRWLAIVAEHEKATGATLANLGTAGIRLANVHQLPLRFSGAVGSSELRDLLHS